MPKSIVEPTLEITEQTWIVSVINSDGFYEGITFGGHAMLVVEGLYKPTPSSLHFQSFVGQYDILAVTTDEENKESKECINIKGRYMVRIYEGAVSTRPAGKEYHRFPHKSYLVNDPLGVRNMIREIKLEADMCERAKRRERDENGTPYEYPLYQKVGSHHFLTEMGVGENCAGWCLRYLQMIVPEAAGTKSIPKKAAGKGCVIL